jgi:pyrroline-5-carboxylate reductase
MVNTMKINKLAIIGGGKMGEALGTAISSSGSFSATEVVLTAKSDRRRKELAERGLNIAASNLDAVRGADVVLVCVKPQMALPILKEITGELSADTLVISIMAGLTIAQIEATLPAGSIVVRAMPNTPTMIGAGMTVITAGTNASDKHLDAARGLFESVGRVMVLEEKHFDAVTSLSASGPAFIYIILEALAEGGVKTGLPRSVATELAASACLGASRMVLETGLHPALLKDMVTTPAGCTIDGILKLEEGGLRVTLIKTIVETARSAKALGKTED